jgi:PAS domain S-box-containing protein
MSSEETDIEYPGFAHLLLESMANGVFTVDKTGKITSFNPAMRRITGYSPEEIIGHTCSMIGFDLCCGRSCPAGIRECRILQKGSIDGKECFLRHKNGHDIPVLKSARLFRDHAGEIAGVVETVMDMSELYKARQEAEEASRKLGEIHRFDRIIGKSDAMQKLFVALKAATSSDATILINGESGTGKELVAGAIHYNSRRKERPFVTVNCSALSESLLESELFGHVRGAFTGAIRDRIGRFEEAEEGTLFLDEIGEISPYIQVKLLRVLQEREVERVGDSKKRKIDIRIITATNKDLKKLVDEGLFREDLYYRLKVFPIHVPPLRERKTDIPILTTHFIGIQNEKTGKTIMGVTQPAMRLLLDHNWPGNVREIENAIEHAFVLCENSHIDMVDLPVEIRQAEFRAGVHEVMPAEVRQIPKCKNLTKERLIDVLEKSGWNKAEAGRRLFVSRAAIWKYMKKWAIPMKQPL